jgi:hypothetical protein
VNRVAYLAIDVNIVYREVAAMEHFWDKLVPGGIVVFDVWLAVSRPSKGSVRCLRGPKGCADPDAPHRAGATHQTELDLNNAREAGEPLADNNFQPS